MTKIKERAQTDINKLEELLEKAQVYSEKYWNAYSLAANYKDDAKFYFEKENYVSSFACANYAFGILDCILIMEGVK